MGLVKSLINDHRISIIDFVLTYKYLHLLKNNIIIIFVCRESCLIGKNLMTTFTAVTTFSCRTDSNSRQEYKSSKNCWNPTRESIFCESGERSFWWKEIK